MEDIYVRLINCRFHLFRSSASSFRSQYHLLWLPQFQEECLNLAGSWTNLTQLLERHGRDLELQGSGLGYFFLLESNKGNDKKLKRTFYNNLSWELIRPQIKKIIRCPKFLRRLDGELCCSLVWFLWKKFRKKCNKKKLLQFRTGENIKDMVCEVP